jgi:hypothetical protein
MHPEVGPVCAELLGRDGKLDRLQQRVGPPIAPATAATDFFMD